MSDTVATVMSAPAVTLTPDIAVSDAADRLAELGFGAMPVVDAGGVLVGILRDSDLLISETTLHAPTIISFFSAELAWPPSVRRYEDEVRKLTGATVGDVMTTEFPTVASTATIEELATLMHDQQVTHVPVVDDGNLVGMVARGDLVRHLARTT